MEQKDIELFCKNRKVKYINHRNGEDNKIYITVEVERITTEREMMPYIEHEKMKPIPGERSGIDDVIDWYNENLRTEMLVEFEKATPEQKDEICNLYRLSCI